MKNLARIITLSVAIVASGMAGGVASAADSCEIGYTGPDSSNLCSRTSTYSCQVSNNNEITFENQNIQLATSGQAGASSGSATNSNGTTFNANVTNGTCTVVATRSPIKPAAVTTPATTQPVTTPKKAVEQPKKVAPAVLPNTSSSSMIPAIVAGIIALGLGVIVAQVAVAAYGRNR